MRGWLRVPTPPKGGPVTPTESQASKSGEPKKGNGKDNNFVEYELKKPVNNRTKRAPVQRPNNATAIYNAKQNAINQNALSGISQAIQSLQVRPPAF